MAQSGAKTVLVTGGSGLVGRALAESVAREENLAKDNIRFLFVSSRDADLTSEEETRLLFNRHKPDFVINLAAKVGGLYANMSNNESFYSTNMAINENVLLWSHRINVEKCISCLSTCIFPDNIECPLDETKIHAGPPHHSNRGYSNAKRQVDILNKHYNQLGSSLFTAIIPTNIYGKQDNFCLERSHVVPGLIHRAYLCATKAKSRNLTAARLKVCGSGKPLRQFIYAPDLADLILWTLREYKDPEPIILCPDEAEEVSIDYVARLICLEMSKCTGVSIDVEYDLEKSDGQFKKTATNKKLRNLNPRFAFTPIEIGIHRVVEWFYVNYPNVRM